MINLFQHLRPAMAAVLLSGCATAIPVIGPALECPVSDADLARKCAAPATLAAGITYQDMIRIAAEDRKNLAECEKHREFLQKALSVCNAEIRKHNERIAEINKANAK